ncbi:MAG: TonB-dependent receptor [Halothece sp.]
MKTREYYFALICTMIGLCSQSSAAWGQSNPFENPDANDEPIELIIINQPIYAPFREEGTVGKSTRPIYTIDREEIEQQGARTVKEALRFLPGILGDGTTGTEVNGLSSQFMRGSNSNQVLILLDGRPINNLGSGGFDLSEITTNIVEQVEILPGGGSTLYGSDAIGGTINIVTRRPTIGFSGEGDLKVGSYGYNEQNLELNDSIGDFSYFFNYNRISADNDYEFTIDDVTRTRQNAEAEFNNLGLRLQQEISDRAQLNFSSFYLSKIEGVPGGVPIADPEFGQGYFNSLTDNNAKFTDQVLSDLSLNVDLGEGNDSRLTARVFLDFLNTRFDNRTEETESLSSSNPRVLEVTEETQQRFDSEQRSLGFQIQHNWDFAANQNIVYGFDYRNTSVENFTQNLETDDLTTNFDDEISQGALFAQYSVEPLSDWKIVLGLRQELSSLVNGSVTSPSVGTKVQFSDSTILRANYIRNFRTPTIDNLFNANPTNIGNPDLEPERGNSFDLGIDQAIGKLGLIRLTYFNNTISDLIAFKRISPPENSVSGTFQNLGKVQTQGIEASLDMEPINNVFMSVGYTLNDPEILESTNPDEEGNELRFAGANKLNLELSYQNRYGWYAGILMNSLGSYPTNNTNTEFLPGYTTFDLRLKAPISPTLKVNAGVQNVFDQRFELFSGFPDNGRTVNVGLDYRF